MMDSIRKHLYLESNMQFTGNRCLEIENCEKVVEYREDYLKFKTSTLIVEVWGKDLRLHEYRPQSICLEGTIATVEFTLRKKGGG